MKKHYIEPEVEIVTFETEDIMAASAGPDIDEGDIDFPDIF